MGVGTVCRGWHDMSRVHDMPVVAEVPVVIHPSVSERIRVKCKLEDYCSLVIDCCISQLPRMSRDKQLVAVSLS